MLAQAKALSWFEARAGPSDLSLDDGRFNRHDDRGGGAVMFGG
jgi:hypothetical protein